MRRLCVATELTRAKRARANMVLSQVAPAGFESAQLVQHARIQILEYTGARAEGPSSSNRCSAQKTWPCCASGPGE